MKMEEDASEHHQEDQYEEDEGKKGSGGISSRIHKSCVDHLVGIFQHPKEPSLYRQVPLMSHQGPSCPYPPAAASELLGGATAVHLPAWHQSEHHHLLPAHIILSPAESWEHYEDRVL